MNLKQFCKDSKKDKLDEPEIKKEESFENKDEKKFPSDLKDIIEFLMCLNYKSYSEASSLIDSNVENDSYKINKVPDPNNFGEAVIYLSPHGMLLQSFRQKNDLSATPLMGALFLLNCTGIFGNGFMPLYINCLTAIFCFKSYALKKFRIIYQINLLNEKQVKIIYSDGEIQIVDIADISQHEKLKEVKTLENFYRKEIYLKVKGQNCLLSFKSQGRICFTEIEILLSILNKNVKQLSS